MIALQITGAKELNDRLKRLNYKVARKIARQATTSAARVRRKSVKSESPRDFGALQKSMTQRVKQYSARGVFVGITGPDRKAEYEAAYKTPWGLKVARTAIPANYIHFVYGGHRIVIGGTLSHALSKAGGGRRTTRKATVASRTGQGRVMGEVPGNKFLQRAAKKSDSAALAQFLANMRQGVARAWNNQI